jgi:hypothetical protein
MSKKFFAALALALGTCSLAFANDPYNSYAAGNGADVFGGSVPSGLRFGGSADVMTVRTGNVEGDVAGGCNSCGAIGCLDWKLNTWYGSWDGHGYGHGHGCRRGCN